MVSLERAIDEYENIISYDFEDDVDEFLDAMDLSKARTEERKRVADKLFALFLSLFVLVDIADYETCYFWFTASLRDIVEKYGFYDAYSMLYINKFAEEYLGVTFNRKAEGDYWLSPDRALLGALNESNAIVGYEELQDAIAEGCEFKIWKTERDNKVRETHRELDGKKIPIDEYFTVGMEQMLYPRDEVNCGDLSEISNCRCHCDFE